MSIIIGASAREKLGDGFVLRELDRTRDPSHAAGLLHDLMRGEPHSLYDPYVARIQRYRQKPPGDGWDGITTFETK